MITGERAPHDSLAERDRRLPANVITMKKDPAAYWLYRQSASTFVMVWAGAGFLTLLIALIALQWVFRHHVNWTYTLIYTAGFTVGSTIGAMFQRRRRLSKAASLNKQNPVGDVKADG